MATKQERKLFEVDDGGDRGEVRCGGCNWDVGALYAVATSKEEADQLYQGGEAGICCDCMTRWLMEEIDVTLVAEHF